MEDNFSNDNNFEEEANDSDLESRLYASIYYMPFESEIPNDNSVASKNFSNKTKNVDNIASSDNNKQYQEFMNDKPNTSNSSNESFRQNEKVIDNALNKVTDTNLVEKIQNKDMDPYVFDENFEKEENITPMRKKSKKKKKAKNSPQTTKDCSNDAPEDLNNVINLLHHHSNTERSDITNVNASKNKSKESSKHKKQDTENVVTKHKGSQEPIKQTHNEKHKEIEEKNSKYTISNKTDKKTLHNAEHCKNKKSKNIDSDSDESILELPIPPKPLPPVINLNDSDEEEVVISKKKSKKKPSLDISNISSSQFKDQVKKALSKSQSELKSLNDSDISTISEDIVLNCTEISKGASSINEIIEMRKNVQKKKDTAREEVNLNVQQQSNKVNNKKNKSAKKTVHSKNKQLDDKNKSNVEENFVEKQNNTLETNLASTNTDFTQDILPYDEFIMSQNTSSPNNKRVLENENQENIDNVKRAKNSDEISKNQAGTSSASKKQENKNKSDDNSFFQPMSESLKAFYNNSRGQENFDVKKIQSKMSKDPRLWTILDDDINSMMTFRSKKLGAKLKCTYCHRRGHLKSDCTDVRKSTKCYICGLEGHKGVRCTERICLTCGKEQDTFRPTCETCRTLYCKMCSAIGHVDTECPDLWRRYHQTTTTDQISVPFNVLGVMKPADRLFCCNCTKRGHDSSTCEDYRWSQHFPTPSFVSNYIDGPTYDKDAFEVNDVDAQNTNVKKSNKDLITNVYPSEDLLPFQKGLIKKEISEKMAFTENIPEERRSIAYVIYECGYFYTVENNGMEITCNIVTRRDFNTYNIMECKVVPYFIEKLQNLFMFHVKIYKKKRTKNEIILRIRTFAHLINGLCRLILYWLSLDDDEKNHVMFMDLPLQRTDLIMLLESEISKVGTEKCNAIELYNSVNWMKIELNRRRNSIGYYNYLTRIKEEQKKLLLVLNSHPYFQTIFDELYEFINILKYLDGIDVPLQAYIQILTIYNFLFVPHTPPKSFVTKYGNRPITDTLEYNAEINSPERKIPVWQNLHIYKNTSQSFTDSLSDNPKIAERNQGSNSNNLTVCKPVQEELLNRNDFIRLENSPATYSHAIYNDSIENINRTEENINFQNSRTSECNNMSETAVMPNEWYNDNNALDRNIIDYNLPSTSYDLYPKDNASDKYTNITVNMSNKNQTDKNAGNLELNMNNSKIDEYQNNDKCTNIIVSVSNKDQTRTCSIENEKEQPENNKYTNITVSISNKDQARNATCSSSNSNNFTKDNSQSTEVNYPENNQLNDENNLVCIEINKNAQRQIENKNITKGNNEAKMSMKQIRAIGMAEWRAKKKARPKHDVATKQINKVIGKCTNLKNLNDAIQKELNIYKSDNPKHWKAFVNKIEKLVRHCQVIHIKRALVVLKSRIENGTILRKNISTFQKMVHVELVHQEEVKNLYVGFNTAS
ncbi:hypothetical protein M0802_002890 [Mischocyttarus mexicanus]|nr:hypothetical protein M0802_002890 [Mischocyttarus mexicanus]